MTYTKEFQYWNYLPILKTLKYARFICYCQKRVDYGPGRCDSTRRVSRSVWETGCTWISVYKCLPSSRRPLLAFTQKVREADTRKDVHDRQAKVRVCLHNHAMNGRNALISVQRCVAARNESSVGSGASWRLCHATHDRPSRNSAVHIGCPVHRLWWQRRIECTLCARASVLRHSTCCLRCCRHK